MPLIAALTGFGARRAASVLVFCVIAGCANKPHRAPVEDRSTTRSTAAAAAASAASGAANATPVPIDAAASEPAPAVAKPGYYIVRPGDTLIRIGLESGQNWRDVQRWNNLDNANAIEVGQVLRVVAPGVDPTAATSRPVTSTRVEAKPLETRPVGASPAPAGVAAVPPPVPTAATTSASGAPSATRESDDITWSWPVSGPLSTPFDEVRSKGLVFRGKAGDPVYAAADGRVVYAGSGLRGYGNLVIIKHNPTYLTAYAHNQTLLVKDDQTVRRGQKIAEMGSTDADDVQLHFEVRRQGKPVDPTHLLPPR